MKAPVFFLLLSALCVNTLFVSTSAAVAQQKAPEGIWEGYDGEWVHVSQQLIALAEATPPEKFAYRPAPGVRSTSEVYMHLVIANFYLLSVTGPKMPADLDVSNVEKRKNLLPARPRSSRGSSAHWRR